MRSTYHALIRSPDDLRPLVFQVTDDRDVYALRSFHQEEIRRGRTGSFLRRIYARDCHQCLPMPTATESPRNGYCYFLKERVQEDNSACLTYAPWFPALPESLCHKQTGDEPFAIPSRLLLAHLEHSVAFPDWADLAPTLSGFEWLGDLASLPLRDRTRAGLMQNWMRLILRETPQRNLV